MKSAAELVADIEGRVAEGRLRPGERLPPVRSLAREVGLASNTVAAAYRTLQSRGIVVAKGRAGSFVADRPPLGDRAMPPLPGGAVDMATGNPDPAFIPDPAGAFRVPAPPVPYGEPSTDPLLAEAMGDLLAADGAPGDPLVPVSGALDGMERVLMSWLRPGDRVVVEDPAYVSVLDLVAVLGLRPVPVPVDDRGPDPDRLAEAVRSGVEAVVITPRAQNPYGSAVPAARAAELRQVLAAHPDLLVIEDDHAGRVSGTALNSVIEPDRPRWAYIRSVAKELGPDLRVAVVVSDPGTRRRVVGRQRVGPGWVSHHLQRAVATLLASSEVGELLGRAASAYRDRRRHVLKRLGEAGVVAQGRSGLNVWVPVADEASIVAAMLERGYAVRGGSTFRLQAPPAVRLTVAGHDFDVLDGAIDALLPALDLGRAVRTG